MKIKPEHRTIIKDAIAKVLVTYPDAADYYERGEFARSDKVKDLQVRFCFDLFYATGLTSWLCDHVYTYANDDNVYSVLKTCCPKVERKY